MVSYVSGQVIIHHMGGQRKVKKMSNLILMRALERVQRLPPKGLGWTIRTAVKYRHSVYFGASMIHAIMQRRQFLYTT